MSANPPPDAGRRRFIQGLAVVLSIMAWGLSIAVFGLVSALWLACLMLAVAGAAEQTTARVGPGVVRLGLHDQILTKRAGPGHGGAVQRTVVAEHLAGEGHRNPDLARSGR